MSHSCYRVYQIDYTNRGLGPITSLTATGNCLMNSTAYFKKMDISSVWYRSCAKNWFRVMYDDQQAQHPRFKFSLLELTMQPCRKAKQNL